MRCIKKQSVRLRSAERRQQIRLDQPDNGRLGLLAVPLRVVPKMIANDIHTVIVSLLTPYFVYSSSLRPK